MNEDIEDALKIILTEVGETKIVWAIVGSLNLAIQGVDIVTHDIDILTTEKDVFKIEKLLEKFTIEPVKYSENEFFKSYLGKFIINNIKVEVMADLQSNTGKASWSKKSRLDKVVLLKFKNFNLPVIPLVEEYKAYKRMGRFETMEKIETVLSNHSK